MKFILGKKLEMTQIFQDNGSVVPVTAVLAQPNVVTQIKTEATDRYSAVQVGFGGGKNIKKPQAGHLKGLDLAKTMKEFRVDAAEAEKIKRGDQITVGVFEKNDAITVVGTSKGKGFQGVVKRHGFHGSPASHGHKDQLRMPGSIGNTDPARVMKGKRMGGHMGDAQVTVTGLKVIDIDVDNNILYISGAVPGARNGLLFISAPGEMKLQEIKKPENQEIKEEVKTEDIVESTEQVVETKAEEPVVEAESKVETEENK